MNETTTASEIGDHIGVFIEILLYIDVAVSIYTQVKIPGFESCAGFHVQSSLIRNLVAVKMKSGVD